MGLWNSRRGSPSSTAANNGFINLERLTATAAPMATTSRPEESLPPYPGNIHPPSTFGTDRPNDSVTRHPEGQTNTWVGPGDDWMRPSSAVARRERRVVWRQRARKIGAPIVTILLIVGVILFVGGVVLPAIRRMNEEQGQGRVEVAEG